MRKHILSIFLAAAAALSLNAQELEMIEFNETSELSAAQFKEYDANGNACALVKLGLVANDPVFEGDVVKSENKGGIYWLYLPQGTDKLTIQTSNFLPLRLQFDPVKSLFTYHMTVAPKGAGDEAAEGDLPVEYLTINVPDDATGVPLTLVKVLSGRFQMGATKEQQSEEKDEQPVRWINLTNDFYIGETEVTQALWEKVMGENPSLFKNPSNPVENISWLDAIKFVQALSNVTGRKFRLPTEAEWEYAARGGQNLKPTKFSGSNTVGEVGWYMKNSNSRPHPVKSKKPNEIGLYDMSGNVWEYCQDFKGSYDKLPKTNPLDTKRTENRVRRGGSWMDNSADALRCAYRRRITEREKDSINGLRVVMEP